MGRSRLIFSISDATRGLRGPGYELSTPRRAKAVNLLHTAGINYAVTARILADPVCDQQVSMWTPFTVCPSGSRMCLLSALWQMNAVVERAEQVDLASKTPVFLQAKPILIIRGFIQVIWVQQLTQVV